MDINKVYTMMDENGEDIIYRINEIHEDENTLVINVESENKQLSRFVIENIKDKSVNQINKEVLKLINEKI